MDNEKKPGEMNRRMFLKVGMVGTTSALLGGSALAEAVQNLAAPGPFVFPKPVYRTLGRTGMKISVVSFGAMLTPEPEVLKIAFDNGVNYVDTARKYMDGKNEEIVAKALKGRRDKVYVATKTLPGSKTKEDIIRDVETSLKTLETDHIDVIQLHNLTDKDRIFIPETREALTKLKQQGKVRFFGVTTHKNQPEVLNALVDDKDRFFDTALVAYNFESRKEIGVAHRTGGQGRRRHHRDEDAGGRIQDRGNGSHQPPSGGPQVGASEPEHHHGDPGNERSVQPQGKHRGHGHAVQVR